MITAPPFSDIEATARALADRCGLNIGLVEITDVGRAADRAAGRAAARQAFARAGWPALGILGHEPDGRPRWPSGWVGSISHGAAVAVAAVSRHHRAVGIDVEESRALDVDDAALVFTDDELATAAQAADPPAMATLLWSAKEAAFKAWSGGYGGLTGVDPVDIRIQADVRAGTLRARAGVGLTRDRPELRRLDGAFGTVGDLLLTVVTER